MLLTTMPHTITPPNPITGRELDLKIGANNYWNLVPTHCFDLTFPDLAQQLQARVALIHMEQRVGQNFAINILGGNGQAIGPHGAVDGRNMSLQLPFAIDPRFNDVLAAFNALGIIQIPHPVNPNMFTSPCSGGPFYGTTPHNYRNNVMTLPAMLQFFKNLGFTIHIDHRYDPNRGPVQAKLAANVWNQILVL